jgi:hypothetical protein
MPQIELVEVRLFEPTDPYNHQVDNIPLQGLIDRILLVNSQVDYDAMVLQVAQGTAGNLANRLAQALNDDGSLKSSAIDAAQHNIAEHTDGSVTVNGIPISYVRMLNEERAKLSGIASGANRLDLHVYLNTVAPSTLPPSQISVISISEVEYLEGEIKLKPSDSVYWEVDTAGALTAHTTFPATVRHIHYYDFVPVHQNLITPDYKNYAVTSTNTPYREGSLRVYLNGIRLTKASNITAGRAPRGNYVPTDFSGSPTWLTYTYSEDTPYGGVVASGKFSLSSAITSSDVITVDFDILA